MRIWSFMEGSIWRLWTLWLKREDLSEKRNKSCQFHPTNLSNRSWQTWAVFASRMFPASSWSMEPKLKRFWRDFALLSWLSQPKVILRKDYQKRRKVLGETGERKSTNFWSKCFKKFIYYKSPFEYGLLQSMYSSKDCKLFHAKKKLALFKATHFILKSFEWFQSFILKACPLGPCPYMNKTIVKVT